MIQKKVLITGGAGFIGSYLTEKLIDSNVHVTTYDLLEVTNPEAEVITGDIFDIKKLKDVTNGIETVIHLVGLPDAITAQRDPNKSFNLNVLSLQNVLEVCRINGVRKIIYPSSGAVYGTVGMVPIDENREISPTNIYAWHKAACERLIRGYSENFGINYIILRLFNVYGVGNSGIIDVLIKKAKAGEEIEIFGGKQHRDFIYVEDVAEAFYRAAAREIENKIINVGSGKGYKIEEVAQMVTSLYPGSTFVSKEQEGYRPYDSIADITLTKNLLGFSPRSSKKFFKNVIEEMGKSG